MLWLQRDILRYRNSWQRLRLVSLARYLQKEIACSCLSRIWHHHLCDNTCKNSMAQTSFMTINIKFRTFVWAVWFHNGLERKGLKSFVAQKSLLCVTLSMLLSSLVWAEHRELVLVSRHTNCGLKQIDFWDQRPQTMSVGVLLLPKAHIVASYCERFSENRRSVLLLIEMKRCFEKEPVLIYLLVSSRTSESLTEEKNQVEICLGWDHYYWYVGKKRIKQVHAQFIIYNR